MADIPQSHGGCDDVSEEEEIYRSAAATAYGGEHKYCVKPRERCFKLI